MGSSSGGGELASVLERQLASNKNAPRMARAMVSEFAEGIDDHARATLFLAVTELVTNAVVHGPGGAVGVRLSRSLRGVRIEVRDTGTHGFIWAHDRVHDDDRPHGLDLVDAFSDRCGVAQTPETLAWCELDVAA